MVIMVIANGNHGICQLYVSTSSNVPKCRQLVLTIDCVRGGSVQIKNVYMYIIHCYLGKLETAVVHGTGFDIKRSCQY